jgi:NAD(P)-dependent dehydrogenase (short-subunit alcohol dehydrogenase family)
MESFAAGPSSKYTGRNISISSHQYPPTEVHTMAKLEGRVAVITGGNSGIGLATAQRLAAEEAYVFITGRRQSELDLAARQIGKNVTGVQGDVSKLADLDRLYATVKQEKGQIDILFANAGAGEIVALGAISEEHPRNESTNVRTMF